MYYGFGQKTTHETLSDKIDGEALSAILDARLPKVKTPQKRVNQLKMLVKNEPEFLALCAELSLTPKQMITIMISVYPHIFNFHLVRFVRWTYFVRDKVDQQRREAGEETFDERGWSEFEEEETE